MMDQGISTNECGGDLPQRLRDEALSFMHLILLARDSTLRLFGKSPCAKDLESCAGAMLERYGFSGPEIIARPDLGDFGSVAALCGLLEYLRGLASDEFDDAASARRLSRCLKFIRGAGSPGCPAGNPSGRN